jgi:hypothetical protein
VVQRKGKLGYDAPAKEEILELMRKISEKAIVIHSLEEIPAHFASEDEERAWWSRHEFGEEIYEQLADCTEELRQLIAVAQKPQKALVAAGG